VTSDLCDCDLANQQWVSRATGDTFAFGDPPTPPDEPDDPTDWQAAVNSRDYDTLRSWYDAHTGYEALGYTEGDLVPGAIVSQYDGQVFEGISASVIRIAHDNVTVRGCLIQGGGTYGYYNNPSFNSTYAGTVIEYCTLIGGDPAIDKAAVLCSSDPSAGIAVTFRYCEITGWSSGFLGNGGCAAEYCWVYDFYPSSTGGAHVSSAVARGSHVRYYRNYLTEGGSPICSIYFDLHPVDNVTIQENILSGRQNLSGNNPSYCLFGKAGDYEAGATNVTVGNNYLGNTVGVDFQFGQVAGFGDVAWGTGGNSHSDNIDFLTGETIPWG